MPSFHFGGLAITRPEAAGLQPSRVQAAENHLVQAHKRAAASASYAATRAAVSKHRAHSSSTWERADPSLGASLPGSEQVAMPKPAAPRQRTQGRRLSPLTRSSMRASRGPGTGRVTARGSYSHCFGIRSVSLSSAIT